MFKILCGVLLCWLVACSPVEMPSGPESEVVRLEVTPGAAMLTAPGETRRLSARAFGADGKEVQATIRWSSSRPAAVTVDADGDLQALTDAGSSQVVASVGGVQSPPTLVTIVQPAAGAVLIADEQVVSPPTAVNPSAEPDLDNEYEVILKDLIPPAPGTVLLGTGAAPIGGKVVTSEAVAGGVRVRLRLATLKEMVLKASFDEVMSFRGAPLELPQVMTDAYTVTQSGDEYTLTPKPGLKPAALLRPQSGAQGTSVFTALPFNECVTSTPNLPVSLTTLPTLTIKIDPTYELRTDASGALERILFRATPSVKATLPLIINADALIALECTSVLYSKLLPLPGWLGLIAAGELEAGLGFELAGKVTLFNAGLELSSESTSSVELGMECVSGDCIMIKRISTLKNDNKVSWKVPSLGQLHVEPSLFGYGYVKAKLGATLLKSLRIEAVGAKAGVKYEASLAPAFVQVQATPAPDPNYQSSYKLAALLEVSAGKKVSGLLTKLGIVKFNALKFSSSLPLGQSPKASALKVDRSSFAPGDALNFSVSLYPDTVSFPLLGYNVSRVIIYRDRLGTVEEVASVTPTPGQTTFEIPWMANIGSAGGGSEFFAFVETKLPSIVDLELGRLSASVGPVLYAGTLKLDASHTEQSAFGDSSSTLLDTVKLDAAVTQGQDQQLTLTRVTQGLASFNFNSQASRQRTDRGCTWRQSFTNHQFETLNAPDLQTSRPGELKTTETAFTLTLPFGFLRGPVTGGQTETASGARISGSCDGVVDFSPVSTTTTFAREGAAPTRLNLPPLSGAVTLDPATGRRAIATTLSAKVDLPQTNPTTTKSLEYTVILDLKQQPDSRQTDLALSLTAPASAAPGSRLTYAVNVQNKGTADATSLRAEFFLPDGFTVLDTQGWSGCTIILTSVTCTASGLAAAERRAFLVDVLAPNSVGEAIVSARITASEEDSDPSNNLDVGATLLAAP